jgi:serine phosphatase RsbU (regulator of sigma subunit)
MDMAVCIIDRSEQKLIYAGANRPVLIFRKGELIELLPDRMPIGTYHHAEEPFKQSVIQLEPDDMVYMFTDGYADQYGYIEKRKYFISNFKHLLTSISQLPLNDQYQLLVRAFFEWKSLEEQTDDVLVVGFKPL